MTNLYPVLNNVETAGYIQLTGIGLSKQDAVCYQTLYESGPLTINKLAEMMRKPYRSVYRNIAELTQKGFVWHVYTGYHPGKYDAVLLAEALEKYAVWQTNQVQQLIKKQEVARLEKRLQTLKLLRPPLYSKH